MGSIDTTPFKPPTDDIEKRRRIMNDLWSEATNDDVWRDYLTSRGISKMTLDRVTDIRGHAAVPFYNDDRTVQTVPAMLSLIRDSKGNPASIHRTYLWDKEYKHREKKIMPTVSSISGGYVQLEPVGEQVILAEGIETALSLSCATGIPAWACISAHNLKSFDSVPERVSQVFICADNDRTFVGQAAAFALAERMKVKRHKKFVQVLMPRMRDWDINDWWRHGGDPIIHQERGVETAGLESWWS